MINFLLIAICLIAGWGVKRLNVLPVDAHKGINTWLFYVAIPAVTLKYVPTIKWSSNILLPALMPVVVWLGAWLLVKLYARVAQVDRQTQAALIITAGLGNTSFLGFPLVSAYYGDDWLSIASICDQVTFLLLSTLAVVTAISASDTGKVEPVAIVKRLFKFPPFIAVLIALTVPHWVDLKLFEPLFSRLALTVIPLALFSVGMQLKFDAAKSEMKHLAVGLSYKLLIAPFIIAVLGLVLHPNYMNASISVFEAAMAPMITAGILASEFELNPRLSSLMVSMGILISLATSGVWFWLLKRLFFE